MDYVHLSRSATSLHDFFDDSSRKKNINKTTSNIDTINKICENVGDHSKTDVQKSHTSLSVRASSKLTEVEQIKDTIPKVEESDSTSKPYGDTELTSILSAELDYLNDDFEEDAASILTNPPPPIFTPEVRASTTPVLQNGHTNGPGYRVSGTAETSSKSSSATEKHGQQIDGKTAKDLEESYDWLSDLIKTSPCTDLNKGFVTPEHESSKNQEPLAVLCVDTTGDVENFVKDSGHSSYENLRRVSNSSSVVEKISEPIEFSAQDKGALSKTNTDAVGKLEEEHVCTPTNKISADLATTNIHLEHHVPEEVGISIIDGEDTVSIILHETEKEHALENNTHSGDNTKKIPQQDKQSSLILNAGTTSLDKNQQHTSSQSATYRKQKVLISNATNHSTTPGHNSCQTQTQADKSEDIRHKVAGRGSRKKDTAARPNPKILNAQHQKEMQSTSRRQCKASPTIVKQKKQMTTLNCRNTKRAFGNKTKTLTNPPTEHKLSGDVDEKHFQNSLPLNPPRVRKQKNNNSKKQSKRVSVSACSSSNNSKPSYDFGSFAHADGSDTSPFNDDSIRSHQSNHIQCRDSRVSLPQIKSPNKRVQLTKRTAARSASLEIERKGHNSHSRDSIISPKRVGAIGVRSCDPESVTDSGSFYSPVTGTDETDVSMIHHKPGVPIQLRSEAYLRDGQLQISVHENLARTYSDPAHMDVKITFVHKFIEQRLPPIRHKSMKNKIREIYPWKNEPVDRDVVNQRAMWLPFNTHTNEEASRRYLQYFGI